MPDDAILVLNAGSSSIKLALYRISGQDLVLAWHGLLEEVRTAPHFHATAPDGSAIADERPDIHPDGATAWVLDWIDHHLGSARLLACGHRVVHGGPLYAEPVRIDDAMLETLATFIPLAPLHQPVNLAPIRAIRAARPNLPQVACFDTAFHRGHSAVVNTFALPYRYYEAGVRRYGFHGLSYDFIASQLPRHSPRLAAGKVVVAHLGNGSSMCAMDGCRSVDTTMGFTALDGLPMGTRTGQIDPGVLLYLMEHDGLSVPQVTDLIYKDSGLKGLSGVSSDMRTLMESPEPRAKYAIDVYIHQIAKQTCALAGTLGGLDGMVFTAGIGEHQPAIRAGVLAKLAWLGFSLDAAANAQGGPRLTTADSRAEAFAIATDEERVIAGQTLALL
ncbi:MAG: acetate/propionate family kinase [Alphaproteobacteria bacterium]|nr:acetate/propionate family kinase [Alphaproteobacteria bacterium]